MKPLATPSAKHMLKRGQRHNDAAKKKACNVVQFAFSKAYGKNTPLFHFCFTFHFWFSTAIFAKKNHPAENLKILNFCPWIPGIFLCNFQPLLPSWPMDKGTPCCTVSKNQQIAVISDRARQSRPKIGLTRCAFWKIVLFKSSWCCLCVFRFKLAVFDSNVFAIQA
jgi:hypothetical protein